MRLNLPVEPPIEQINRAIPVMDDLTQQNATLVRAMSAFKLEAYAFAQMQRVKPAVTVGAAFPAMQLRAA